MGYDYDPTKNKSDLDLLLDRALKDVQKRRRNQPAKPPKKKAKAAKKRICECKKPDPTLNENTALGLHLICTRCGTLLMHALDGGGGNGEPTGNLYAVK